jgi:hypothetical protein
LFSLLVMSFESRDADVVAYRLTTIHLSECTSSLIMTTALVSSIPVYVYTTARGTHALRLSSTACLPTDSFQINSLLTYLCRKDANKPIICAFRLSCLGKITTKESTVMIFHKDDLDVRDISRTMHYHQYSITPPPIQNDDLPSTSQPPPSSRKRLHSCIEIQPSAPDSRVMVLTISHDGQLKGCDHIQPFRQQSPSSTQAVQIDVEPQSSSSSLGSWVLVQDLFRQYGHPVHSCLVSHTRRCSEIALASLWGAILAEYLQRFTSD